MATDSFDADAWGALAPPSQVDVKQPEADPIPLELSTWNPENISTIDMGFGHDLRRGGKQNKLATFHDVGRERLANALGDSYKSDSFVDNLGDVVTGLKLGWAQTPGKEKEIAKDAYGELGEVRHYDLGRWGKHSLLTKDGGETWQSINSKWDWIQAAPETAASVAFGPSGLGWNIGRTVKAGLAAAGAKLTFELPSQMWWEEGRQSPWQSALIAGGAEAVGQGLSDYLLQPLLTRFSGIRANDAVEAANKAAVEEGLQPFTKGQAFDSGPGKATYKQIQGFVGPQKRKALERFASMKEGLDNWVSELSEGLEDFSPIQLEALRESSVKNIESMISGVRKAKMPLSQIGPKLSAAVDTFNKASTRIRNDQYDAAFRIAEADDLHFNTTPLKDKVEQLRRGVPIKQEPVTTTSTGTRQVQPENPYAQSKTVPTTTTSTQTPAPDRLLTPSSELEGIFDSIDTMAAVLTKHAPDGTQVSSLEQLNALRRNLSQYAYDMSGNNANQARLASEALEILDDVMANPVGNPSMAYHQAFSAAQNTHMAWNIAKDLKKTAQLDRMDISTYENYIKGLFRPGNSAYIDVVEQMLSGTPGAFDALRDGFVSQLLKNPEQVGKSLKSFSNEDPALLAKLIPSKADREAIEAYGKNMSEYNKSWLAGTLDTVYASNERAAVSLFEGKPEAVSKNIDQFIKNHPDPEEGTRQLQAAYLSNLIDKSKTGKSFSLPDAPQLIEPIEFNKLLEETKDIAKNLFGENGFKRLQTYENYGTIIRKTGVDVPGLARHGGASAEDFGQSLAVASSGEVQRNIPSTVIDGGPTKAAGLLARIHLNPRIMAFVIGSGDDLASEGIRGAGRISNEGFTWIHNFNRIWPALKAHDLTHSPAGADHPLVQDQLPLGP
jgi:hypothetical protein